MKTLRIFLISTLLLAPIRVWCAEAANGWQVQAEQAMELIRKNRLEEARRISDQFYPLVPDRGLSRQAYVLLITVLGVTDQEDLVAYLKRAMKAEPNNADHPFNLAVVCATTGKPDIATARIAYARALALGSERDEVFEKLIK